MSGPAVPVSTSASTSFTGSLSAVSTPINMANRPESGNFGSTSLSAASTPPNSGKLGGKSKF